MTVRARQFWICWRRDNWELFILERITVINIAVDDRGSNRSGSWRIEVRPDTAKLTYVIVTGFGERCNSVRESKMFVKGEAKVSSRVGDVKWRVVYFVKLVFESMIKNSFLDDLRVRRIAVVQEETCRRAFWRWEMLESKLSVICMKMVIAGKRRDKSTERGSVHDEE